VVDSLPPLIPRLKSAPPLLRTPALTLASATPAGVQSPRPSVRSHGKAGGPRATPKRAHGPASLAVPIVQTCFTFPKGGLVVLHPQSDGKHRCPNRPAVPNGVSIR